MLDFLFYIFQAIGSFFIILFIILLFFHEAIFLFIISAFCWSLAIHNILLLNIKKKYKFFFVGLILAIIFGSGAYEQDYIFLVCAVIFTPIFLYLLRKKLHNFYIFKLQKSLIAFGLFGTMVCVWQLEVPQKIIINMFDDKIEIFDNNYTVLENNDKSNIVSKLENNGYLPEIQLFEIYFRKREIYIYDDINKTINERKIAEIKTPFIAESTLMCFLRNIETGGRCTGFTNGSKYKVNGKKFTLNELLKQYQKGEQK